MSVRSASSTVVDRLLSSPPSRLDEQLAGVLFAVTFVGGCAVIVAARRLGRIVDVSRGLMWAL